jgi:small-conductance mechanosensitive channel
VNKKKALKRYEKQFLSLIANNIALVWLSVFLLLTIPAGLIFASPSETLQSVSPGQQVDNSPVIVDHMTLFWVRGIKAYPAKERADNIAKRIRQIAADQSIHIDSITAAEAEDRTNLMAGNAIIASIVDADAAIEGISRQQLGEIYVRKIQIAIGEYRQARAPENIARGTVYIAAATVLLIILMFLIMKLYRKLFALLETRFVQKLSALQAKSPDIIKTKQIQTAIKGILKSIHLIILLLLFYIYLERVLHVFPWTRFYADRLLEYFYAPLKFIGLSILKEIPDLIFLAILFFIVRLFLKFMHIFFRQIEQGRRTILGFYPEWAHPTDRLLTFLVILFALVVAFPYIPGSNSAAFKGISIFVGIIFSLGSQSVVSNTIAGFIVNYRRAFRVGDRIQVNNIIGNVTEIRMQVTHMQTIKNEEVIVPNSAILSSNIINYSSLAREKGLILHTEVTIGYDAPWRQVHEILLRAAERTTGLLKEPPPFVLQKSLDDFFVRYELNVYTDSPQMMPIIYSDLHKNIQDSFNEHGVQIMSPHYLGDPARMKIVPKDDWYKPPAKPLEKGDTID